MLTDEARNRAFARALEVVLQPGMRVLDLGAGCGPWAMLAAQRGAGRIVAVERNPAVLPLLRALVAAHGLRDRIEIVAGDSRQLALDGPFDLIVSETIGSQAFDESIVPIVRDARARWLAPGGVIVPARLGLRAAPARRRFALGAPQLGAGLPTLDVSALATLQQQFPAPMPPGCTTELLATPVSLVEVDLLTVDEEPSLAELTATFTVDDPSQVEGVAVWVHAELAPGVTLASTDCPSWTQLFYPIDRLPPERAEVRFTLDARPASVQWSVECGDVTHLHSPHLARAWWQAHAGR